MNQYKSICLLAGKFFMIISCCFIAASCTTRPGVVTAETALADYLDNEDRHFSFHVNGSDQLEGLVVHDLILTSQQWREHTWKHTLTILAPEDNKHDGAFLFITGGRNEKGEPLKRERDQEFVQTMARIALENKALVAIVWQIPNQPLYDDLYEDALISFTLHNFRNDGDFTWPLLFPMVKSAVRAMDAIQAFSKETLGHEISRFVVTGASKRGWTTWLTGAVDPRVEAIAPMVIDVLNMPVNLDYQVRVWSGYSIQIQDYVKLGMPQQVHSDTGKLITTMIDPYTYRESLTMPKMILIGTNDEYWPVDAIRHYLDGLPGENYIHYVPNAGHGLGDGVQAVKALSAFFGYTLSGQAYPACSWRITENEQGLLLTTETSPDKLLAAMLWTADSEDRDFRDESWSSTDLAAAGQARIETTVDLPESGYRAFYLDLRYPGPNGGEYTQSTRMFVASDLMLLED